MALPHGSNVLRQLRFVVASWRDDPRTDAELLGRFAQTRDEQAFGTLVGRHGQFVWGVCQRVLRNHTDAEDATQAVFLRLARDAKRIANREALAGWLARVARDCAVDLQRSILRQRRIEERLAEVASRSAAPQSDLRMLLDDELAQLPATARAALVLCGIEGRTYADAALELGCSVAAVHRRFVRAQTLLRRRLAKHGPAATAMLAAAVAGVVPSSASAAPPALLARAVEAGMVVARTGTLPANSAGRVAAADGARGLSLAGIAAGVLLLALLAAGAAFFAPQSSPPEQTSRPDAEPPHGTTVSGVVRGPDGAPVAGASVVALGRRPFGPGERGLRDEVLAGGTTDAAGRFALPVADGFETWFADRTVTVRVAAAGLAPATRPVLLRPGASVELDLAAASPLVGKLVDPEKRPAGGVRVAVVRVGDAVAEPVVGATPRTPPAWPAGVTTDAAGQFALPNLGGCENVWVRVGDSKWATDTFRVDKANAPFVVEPACQLAVQVVADDTGEPLAGARLTLISERIASHPHFCTNAHGALGPYSVPADVDAVADDAGRVQVGFAAGDTIDVLVHPPASAGPYVGVRATVEMAGAQSIVVRVPRGIWVSGTVTDAAGRPLAGASAHWGREDSSAEWRDKILLGRDAIVRTAADGTFRLAVLPGACSIRAYGPTLDHPAVPVKRVGKSSVALFAHAVARIDVPARGEPPAVRLALEAGTRVSGEVDARASDATFVLCSGRVSPVRGYAALPLPVRRGEFAVPGCRPGSLAKLSALDPVARVGGVAELSPGVKVKLAECGRIRVRVVDRNGTGVAGQDVVLSLLVERERRKGEEAVCDAQPVEWFDPVNYPRRPKTDADGWADLPALIPGARYALAVDAAGRVAVGTFDIEAGRTITPPDVKWPAAAEGGTR